MNEKIRKYVEGCFIGVGLIILIYFIYLGIQLLIGFIKWKI